MTDLDGPAGEDRAEPREHRVKEGRVRPVAWLEGVVGETAETAVLLGSLPPLVQAEPRHEMGDLKAAKSKFEHTSDCIALLYLILTCMR